MNHSDANKAFVAYRNMLKKSFEFYSEYNQSLIHAWSKAVKSTYGVQREKIEDQFRTTFDTEFRSTLKKTPFCNSLSDFTGSYMTLAPMFGHDKIYRNVAMFTYLSDSFLEPIRDIVNRTPSEIIPMKGRFEVHHYKSPSTPKFKTPILVVGSLINRHYILDLLPETSIIRYFQQLGFDVYATDWKMPTISDENMTLTSYAHDYLENAVDKVEEITGSRNVNLFGYCWGGILSLIYSALNPGNVKSLILHATPADFGKAPTVLESWLTNLDVGKFVQTFGNIPSFFLNMAFLMRNPIEASLKYSFYFSRPRTIKEITQFLAVESWLYDSVPIIGKAFEQIINDIYKKNLLIQNKMMLGKELVDLKKITMPVLNIVGTNDDLVSAESSRTITEVISSNDKKTLEFPTGHVGLCISKTAHKKLWPDVGNWLKEHSV